MRNHPPANTHHTVPGDALCSLTIRRFVSVLGEAGWSRVVLLYRVAQVLSAK
jgi:hypothetical protein